MTCFNCKWGYKTIWQDIDGDIYESGEVICQNPDCCRFSDVIIEGCGCYEYAYEKE